MTNRFLIVAGTFLVLLLPVRLNRASIENSLTVDETFSLMLASHSVPELLELTQVDQHPPGFYLLLKAWHALGRSLKIAPSVFWSRLPAVCAWMLLVLACAWAATNWLTLREALLMCLVVCDASAAADVSRLAGIYAISFVALFLCFLILMRELLVPPQRFRDSAASIIGYVLCGAAALWVHLLSAPVLAFYAILWLASCARGTNRKQRLLRALAAQAGIALLFLPWAIKLPAQLAAFSNDPRTWTTPPTFRNLLYVFTIWYPFGTISENAAWTRSWEVGLGASAILLPLVIHAVSFVRSEKHKITSLAVIGWCALAITCANVLLLWSLERLKIAHTFHGPRYPVFTATLWSVAIGALSLDAVHRLRFQTAAAVLLCAPWIACAMLGQAWALKLETDSGLENLGRSVAAFPEPADTVFFMPTELMPYHRALLDKLHARPIEQLFDISNQTSDVAILNLNPWPGTDKPSNVFIRAVINGDQLSQRRDSQKIPNEIMGYTLHWLRGYKHDAAAQLRKLNFAPPPAPIPAAAIAVALAEDQHLTDGWSPLNATTSLYFTRFARAPQLVLRFKQSVQPGNYRMRFIGQYYTSAGEAAHVVLKAKGETTACQFDCKPGTISATIPLKLNSSHDPLLVKLVVPSAAAPRSSPARQRPELHLFFAWLEKA